MEKLRDMGSIDISNMKGLLVLCHLDAIFGMSLPNCRTRNYIWNMMAFVKPNVMHFSRVWNTGETRSMGPWGFAYPTKRAWTNILHLKAKWPGIGDYTIRNEERFGMGVCKDHGMQCNIWKQTRENFAMGRLPTFAFGGGGAVCRMVAATWAWVA